MSRSAVVRRAGQTCEQSKLCTDDVICKHLTVDFERRRRRRRKRMKVMGITSGGIEKKGGDQMLDPHL